LQGHSKKRLFGEEEKKRGTSTNDIQGHGGVPGHSLSERFPAEKSAGEEGKLAVVERRSYMEMIY